MATADLGRVGKPTGLSQAEPQEGLGPSGFDPSRGVDYSIPDGMVAVTKEEFLAFVGPRDIVLNQTPDYTSWETRGRYEVGRSYPGWRNSGGSKVYVLHACDSGSHPKGENAEGG